MRKFTRVLYEQQAVTLVEMIIYIGILSVVLVGLVSIMMQLINLKVQADTFGMISSEATNAYEHIIHDIHDSDSFTVVSPAELNIQKGATTKIYTLQEGQIYLNDGEDVVPITSSLVNVSQLTFVDWTSPNSDSLLRVEVTFERGGISEDFQTSIHSR